MKFYFFRFCKFLMLLTLGGVLGCSTSEKSIGADLDIEWVVPSIVSKLKTQSELQNRRSRIEEKRKATANERIRSEIDISRLQLLTGQPDAAMQRAKQVLVKDPGNQEARSLVVESLIALKEWSIAQMLLEDLEPVPGFDRIELARLQAVFANARGDATGAAQILSFAFKDKSRMNGAACLQLAQLWLDGGHLDRAKGELAGCFRGKESRSGVMLLRAQIAQGEGRHSEALIEYTRLNKIFPASSELKYFLARSLVELKNTEKAKNVLEPLVQDPDFKRSGNWEAAVVLLEKVKMRSSATTAH